MSILVEQFDSTNSQQYVYRSLLYPPTIVLKENESVAIEENILDFSSKISSPKSGDLFSTIVGYNDVKKIFAMSITSQKPVHILLVGPPASAKTLFMLECMKLERSYFTLGSHSTKSGMLEYLFERRPRYLIVDEIEHMGIRDQTGLLS